MYRRLPTIRISGGLEACILSGGLGALVSGPRLAAAVADNGGAGTVSAVGGDRYELGLVGNFQVAIKRAILKTMSLRQNDKGLILLNVMSLMESFEASVVGAIEAFEESSRGATDGKPAGGIVAGAGLALSLAKIAGNANVVLIPIVSSARALRAICRSWDRVGRKPDAVVLEGPLAGGHLGFNLEDVKKPEFQLESIFEEVQEECQKNGIEQLIVAGGIWDHADIIRWLKLGAAGVQLGTRFLATEESGASNEFKAAVVGATADNIIVVGDPGSPSGFPFRIIANSPGYIDACQEDAPPVKCNLGYMLHNGDCRAIGRRHAFCICNGLLSAVGMNPDPTARAVYTVGANACRVDRIMPVRELMQELTMVAA